MTEGSWAAGVADACDEKAAFVTCVKRYDDAAGRDDRMAGLARTCLIATARDANMISWYNNVNEERCTTL